jgi:hypothetical protein
VTPAGLAACAHRTSYDEDGETGRDRWEVRIVNAWIRATVPPLLAIAAPGPVIDADCGAQPFRALVESNGRRYVDMDAIQNSSNSVAVLSDLENVPASSPRDPFTLCTEVLEHVVEIDRPFDGLRRLTATGGYVVLTVPSTFPVHMEPFDFRRRTEYGISQLAADHGFAVVSLDRLGCATDGLATWLDDTSVMPATTAPYDRLKARLLRVTKSWLVDRLDSPALSRHVTINAHYDLSNGVVLKAR